MEIKNLFKAVLSLALLLIFSTGFSQYVADNDRNFTIPDALPATACVSAVLHLL